MWLLDISYLDLADRQKITILGIHNTITGRTEFIQVEPSNQGLANALTAFFRLSGAPKAIEIDYSIDWKRKDIRNWIKKHGVNVRRTHRHTHPSLRYQPTVLTSTAAQYV